MMDQVGISSQCIQDCRIPEYKPTLAVYSLYANSGFKSSLSMTFTINVVVAVKRFDRSTARSYKYKF